MTQVVPPIETGTANYPAVKEYLVSMNRYYLTVKPGFVSLEGYLATKVFVEALRRAGKNLTREGFIDAVEGIRDLDIQAGNKINFAKDNHQGSQTVYPTIIKGGKFYPIDDWNAVQVK